MAIEVLYNLKTSAGRLLLTCCGGFANLHRVGEWQTYYEGLFGNNCLSKLIIEGRREKKEKRQGRVFTFSFWILFSLQKPKYCINCLSACWGWENLQLAIVTKTSWKYDGWSSSGWEMKWKLKRSLHPLTMRTLLCCRGWQETLTRGRAVWSQMGVRIWELDFFFSSVSVSPLSRALFGLHLELWMDTRCCTWGGWWWRDVQVKCSSTGVRQQWREPRHASTTALAE